ncbi:antitoxin (DNA-binding transcriptional repressor) of toxin-antitoxin stability system [Bradyrhizobium sp. LM3.4]
MKAKVFLSLILLCGGLAAPSARAGDVAPAASAAPPACELPSYLLTSESQLPKVADAVKAGKPLEILVIGSRSTTITSLRGRLLSGADAGHPEGQAAAVRDRARLRRNTEQEDGRGSGRQLR